MKKGIYTEGEVGIEVMKCTEGWWPERAEWTKRVDKAIQIREMCARGEKHK